MLTYRESVELLKRLIVCTEVYRALGVEDGAHWRLNIGMEYLDVWWSSVDRAWGALGRSVSMRPQTVNSLLEGRPVGRFSAEALALRELGIWP